MPQSLANIIVHIVFSTIDRRPFLLDADIRAQMHRQIGGASKTLKCPPMIVGGVEDHIHMLARQARTITLAEWIKEVTAGLARRGRANPSMRPLRGSSARHYTTK